MRILVNATNIHVGGGVQVATSFIAEIANMPNIPVNLTIWASSEVAQNLESINCDLTHLSGYEVINTSGLSLLASPLMLRMRKFDSVFTIFGPLYVIGLPVISVMGFAQPWIIYPKNDTYLYLQLVQKLKLRLKYWLQGLFFKSADHLVVELNHVKDGLVRELSVKPEKISVVNNCLSRVYLDQNLWKPIVINHSECGLHLGFLGRNYVHKNTKIFPSIASVLSKVYGINVKFYVTFNDEEWSECTQEFKNSCVNVGPLSVAECPSFYKALDGVVFPSLLECFSAMPLEAMAMEKPLFVSDRPFNRNVCKEHAHYFDPLSPESAAKEIAMVFANGGPDYEALLAAREYAVNLSNPKERADKYLALLMQCTDTTGT